MSAMVASIDASYFDDTCACAVPATPATTPKANTVAMTAPMRVFLRGFPFLSIGRCNDGSSPPSSPPLSGSAQPALTVRSSGAGLRQESHRGNDDGRSGDLPV